MPYITIKSPPRYIQMSFEDMIAGVTDLSQYTVYSSSNTITRFTKLVSSRLLENTDVSGMIEMLEKFNEYYEPVFKKERSDLYYSFYEPKSSGGVRRIDAPCDELKAAQRSLKAIFENHIFALHHTSAHGFVKNRCNVTSLKRHQKNESNWYLKMDFANFFGSITFEFAMRMLSMIFPFSKIVETEQGKAAFETSLSLCFYNGVLPQGSPISPLLTNLVMLPIDHRFSNSLHNFDNRSFVYTRYADDMTISCKIDFAWDKVRDLLLTILSEFEAPLSIKDKKTHYGSRSGRNWCLGVMLNKDNEMSIGRAKKRQLERQIFKYIQDRKNNIGWPLEAVQQLNGYISYARTVEAKNIDAIIDHYNKKLDADFKQLVKEDLSPKPKQSKDAA